MILKWLMVFDLTSPAFLNVLIDLVLLILLLEEFSDQSQHLPDVVVGATEARVLLDGELKHLDLLAELGNMV